MMWSGHTYIKRWSLISLSLNLGRLVQLTPCFLEVLLGVLSHHIRSLTFPRPLCLENVKPHREAASGQSQLQPYKSFHECPWTKHTLKGQESKIQSQSWGHPSLGNAHVKQWDCSWFQSPGNNLCQPSWHPTGAPGTKGHRQQLEVHAGWNPDPQSLRGRQNTRFSQQVLE